MRIVPLILLLALASCSDGEQKETIKAGPRGPAGSAGSIGATGPQGPKGEDAGQLTSQNFDTELSCQEVAFNLYAHRDGNKIDLFDNLNCAHAPPTEKRVARIEDNVFWRDNVMYTKRNNDLMKIEFTE